MDCMLSEERIAALVDALNCHRYSDESTLSDADVIRRFFAPPPGSVRVEVAVGVHARSDGSMIGESVCLNVDCECLDRKRAIEEIGGYTDNSHLCFATLYVPPVPPTPVVEVVQ